MANETSLRDIYQEVIIDHNRSPRNFRRLTDANRTAEGLNPLCGDHLTLYLKVIDEVIQSIAFQGEGCAISTASASLLTEALQGKTLAEAENLFAQVHQYLTLGEETNELGKLLVLGGVREYPARMKCATLAWHTLKAALENKSQAVSTES